MSIEIVDLPSYKMVIVQYFPYSYVVFCMFARGYVVFLTYRQLPLVDLTLPKIPAVVPARAEVALIEKIPERLKIQLHMEPAAALDGGELSG
jgi:hypothetical protein